MNQSSSVTLQENVGLQSEVKVKKLNNYIYLFVKRIIDVLFGIVGMIAMIPLAFIIKAVSICNRDYNSIFYKQERIGKNGKIFNLYKFRSMVPDADKILENLLKEEKYREEWDKFQKIKDDPRITKIGKFLRNTSLDELPQFINILKGEMSLIGPRPLVKGELDDHNGNHAIYESVKPGLTSWWACNGRSDTTYDKRLQLEYFYCNNASLLLDIKIIFKTAYVVLGKKGAK